MSARFRLPFHPSALLAAEDDRALLARFAAERDGDAFAALVRRHGPMVLGVCRRTVRDVHLADDAFQAAFLVLARKPDAVRESASLASYLFGVARRVALAARRREARAKNREAGVRNQEMEAGADPEREELLRVLDEELTRLPDDLRAPLIACYLDDRTQDEAARQLGWSLSTLRRRLERGKELLGGRLARRGVTAGAGLAAGFLSPAAWAETSPVRLVEATVAATKTTPSGVVTALAAAGARGGISASVAASVVLLSGLAAAAGVLAIKGWPAVDSPIAHLAPAARAEWVVVQGQIVFPKGKPIPERVQVKDVGHDAAHCLSKGPIYDEKILLDPETRGIANAFIWLRPDDDDLKAAFPRDRIHPDLRTLKPQVRQIEMPCCQFQARATAARVGDALRFINRAPVPHNVHYQGVGNPEDLFNVMVPAGQSYDAPNTLTTQRGPAIFYDAIHPWMRGMVWTFDHPYFAITDAKGRFVIPRAPVGRWRLVCWHEEGGYRNGRLGEVVEVLETGRVVVMEFDVNAK